MRNDDSAGTTIVNSARSRSLSRFNDSLYTLFAKSPKELPAILGIPKKMKCEQYINIHNGDIDSVYAIEFDSASISLYYVSAQKRFLLISAELQNNSLIHILGLHLGDSDSSVIKAIGLPYKSETDSTGVIAIIYESGEVAESYTQFHFKDSKLIKVLFQPYLD
jgi:hypothetical protein